MFRPVLGESWIRVTLSRDISSEIGPVFDVVPATKPSFFEGFWRSMPHAMAKAKAGKQSIPTDAEIETEAARKRQEAAWARQRAAEERWRTELRPRALRLIASRTSKLAWSRGLIATLLDELNVDAMFTELVGRPQGLASRRYPQAIAVALALRHSWRREDLVKFAKRFGVKLTTKDLSDAATTDTADAPAPDADATGGAEASVH
jgi:hypothetical protein